MSQQVFISVLYGDNKEELFNPNCKCLILLECLREKSDTSKDGKLDLMEETGLIANISDKEHLNEYANHFLEGRKRYILIKIVSNTNAVSGYESDSSSSRTIPFRYESLLNNTERLYPEIADRLVRLSKRTHSTLKGKKWVTAKKHISTLSYTKFNVKNTRKNSSMLKFEPSNTKIL